MSRSLLFGTFFSGPLIFGRSHFWAEGDFFIVEPGWLVYAGFASFLGFGCGGDGDRMIDAVAACRRLGFQSFGGSA